MQKKFLVSCQTEELYRHLYSIPEIITLIAGFGVVVVDCLHCVVRGSHSFIYPVGRFVLLLTWNQHSGSTDRVLVRNTSEQNFLCFSHLLSIFRSPPPQTSPKRRGKAHK